VLSLLLGGFGNTVKKQKTKSILLWFVVLNSIGVFSSGSNSSQVILTFALPIVFIVGDFLYSVKQIKITNTILTLLFLCVVIIYLAQYNLI
jgi:uncharacterized membrane protein YjdF